MLRRLDGAAVAAKWLRLGYFWRRRSIGIVALALLAACGERPTEVEADVPVRVRALVISERLEPGTVEAVGSVAFRREVSLAFTSGGRIASIAVEEGQSVARGQALASLDSTNLNADLAKARAELSRAQRELDRSQQLFDQGWVTRLRLDAAIATAAAARAALEAARFQSSYARIVAPSSGVVLQRLAQPAQVVQPGQGVVRLGLVASGRVLRVALTERDVARVASSAAATVEIPVLADARFSGRVIELAGSADPATGTFDALVLLPPDGRLRAGQVGKATLTAIKGTPKIVLPAAAIFGARADEGLVYVIDSSLHVRLRKVTLGSLSSHGITISSGVAPGERVVVAGVDRLIDGAKVAIVDRGS